MINSTVGHEPNFLLDPRRHWSLWDMLKENAEAFMALGEEMLDARLIYDMDEFTTKDSLTGHQKLTEEGKESLIPELQKLLALCKRLNLSTSSRLIGRRLGYQDSLPNSLGEFDLLMEVVRDELRSQLFLFVPQHVAEFYSSDTIVSEKAAESFPSAAQEIRNAGTCLAVGQYTASVFHSMRAAEIGVRSLALAMKVELKKPIEQAEWMDILNGLTGRIRDIENMPRGTPGRDEDRAGRVRLDSLSRTIGGSSAGYRHAMPFVGLPPVGRRPTGGRPTNGDKNHAAAASGRLSKYAWSGVSPPCRECGLLPL